MNPEVPQGSHVQFLLPESVCPVCPIFSASLDVHEVDVHPTWPCNAYSMSHVSLDDDVLTDLILLVNMANMAFKTFHIDGWNPFFVPFLKWTTESLMYYTI